MPEQPFPDPPPWRGRPLNFTLAVREHEGGLRAHVAWSDDDEVLATCDAGTAADALAGAAAALTSIIGRIEVAEGFRRGVESAPDALGALQSREQPPTHE
jgi:hypothetical protein